MTEAPIIVVGAGMAGLACAVELCRRGKAVTVLEAAPAIGGRTRSFIYRGVELDNGQHLMLSCYDQTHKLRNIVQADTGALYRQPFIWSIYSRPAPTPATTNDSAADTVLAPSQSKGVRGMLTATGDSTPDTALAPSQSRGARGVLTVTGGSGPDAALADAVANGRCGGAAGEPSSGLVKFSAGNAGGVYDFLGQLSAGAGGSGSLAQRLSVVGDMLKLLLWPAPGHASAAQWLRRSGQDQALCKWLWEPLCLAALNTPAHEASAVCLQAILRRVAGKMGALEFVFNRTGLSEALADPCRRFLTQNGASVLTGHRVSALHCRNDGAISGVRTSDGRDWPASAVVLSVPPAPCQRLLDDGGPIAQAFGQTLKQMDAITLAPIHTLYLQFDEALEGSEAIFGLVDEPIDWVIDRSIVNGQSGLLAVVCSARRIDAPLEDILGLLGEIYGRLPRLLWHKSVVEKHAAFYCSSHIHALRPPARTAVDGLWLNGDWISHSFPSTIETAVSNGFSCVAQMTD